MKAVTGALVILASSIYAIAAAIVMASTTISRMDAPIFGFPAFCLLFLGLYFLFIAKDKGTDLK